MHDRVCVHARERERVIRSVNVFFSHLLVEFCNEINKFYQNPEFKFARKVFNLFQYKWENIN